MKISAIRSFNYSNQKNNINKKNVSFGNYGELTRVVKVLPNGALLLSNGYTQPPAPTYGWCPGDGSCDDDDYSSCSSDDDDSSSYSSSTSSTTSTTSTTTSSSSSEKDTKTDNDPNIDDLTKEKWQTSDESQINIYRNLFDIYNNSSIKEDSSSKGYFDTMRYLAKKSDEDLKTTNAALKDITLINLYTKNQEEKTQIIKLLELIKGNPEQAKKLRGILYQIVKEYDDKKAYEKRVAEMKEKQQAEIKELEALRKAKERELEEQKNKINEEIEKLKAKHEEELANLK